MIRYGMPPTSAARRGPRPLAAALMLTFATGAMLVATTPAHAIVPAVPDATAGADGEVRAIVQTGNRIFIGGRFTWAGPFTGNGVPTNPSTGRRQGAARITGTVRAAEPDGGGGWYLGGDFIQANGRSRLRLARILSTGVLASWNPGSNGTVRAIAMAGNVVYVGGSFTSIGGQARANLAAIGTDGVVRAWNPGANGPVNALDVSPDGSTIYVGGSFGNLGGASRSNVGAVSAATGAATSWNPGTDGAVNAVDASPDGSTVYVGGSFGDLGGASRSNVGAVSAATGAATSWNPGTDGAVNAVLERGGTVYLGGGFSAAAGIARSRLAAVDASSGNATTWNPGADAPVLSLESSGDGTVLFAGGEFTHAGGAPRNRAAAFDRLTGALTGWDPSAEAPIHAVVRSSGQVLVGGAFKMLNGAPRANLAALDATTGEVDRAWSADTDGFVYALEASADGSTVYAGGQFTQVAGQARSNLAAIDASTGAVLGSTPGVNNVVRALELHGTRLYAGGAFSMAGTVNTGRVAAIDTVTGKADVGFKPKPNGTVRTLSITPDGTTLYVGGAYTTIAGVARPGIAALGATTGVATPWNPSVNGVVLASDIAPDGGRVYFSTSSNRTWAFPTNGSMTQDWTLHTGGDVQAIGASATTVYLGGHFTSIPDVKVARTRTAAVDAATGDLTSWSPGTNGSFGPWAMEVTASSLLMGGDFTKVAGRNQPRFARFSGTP